MSDDREDSKPMSFLPPPSVTEQLQRSIDMLKRASLEQKVHIMIEAKLIPPDEIEDVLAKARSIDAEELAKKEVKKRNKQADNRKTGKVLGSAVRGAVDS